MVLAKSGGRSAVTLWYQVAPRTPVSCVVISLAFTLGFACGILTVVYFIFGQWNFDLWWMKFNPLCIVQDLQGLIERVLNPLWCKCVGAGAPSQYKSICTSPQSKDNVTGSVAQFCFLIPKKHPFGSPRSTNRSRWQSGKFTRHRCRRGTCGKNQKQMQCPELEVTMMMNEKQGVKRQAAFEHLEFCNRSVRKSALKYPWDSTLQYNPHGWLDMVRPSGATPIVVNSTAIDNQQDETPKAPPSLCKKFWTKQPRIDWEVKLNAMRESAIVKWQRIVVEGPTVFEVSRYFFMSIKDGHETGTLFDCLKNVFANKSTRTLNSRVGPLLRYVFYCKTTAREAFPLVEAQVYEYMLHEESKEGAAPTYLRSFVSSLAFCHYVLGLQGHCGVEEDHWPCFEDVSEKEKDWI